MKDTLDDSTSEERGPQYNAWSFAKLAAFSLVTFKIVC